MDDTFTIDMDSEYISDVGDGKYGLKAPYHYYFKFWRLQLSNLYLSGKDSPCLPVTIDIPFNVVALHQSFREDTQSLSLQAVVIPNFYYKPEAKRGRKKAKVDCFDMHVLSSMGTQYSLTLIFTQHSNWALPEQAFQFVCNINEI